VTGAPGSILTITTSSQAKNAEENKKLTSKISDRNQKVKIPKSGVHKLRAFTLYCFKQWIVQNQGCKNLPQMYVTSQNSRHQKGDMKQGSTSISCQHKTFSHQGDPVPGISALLL
jgi:hypothetical protein